MSSLSRICLGAALLLAFSGPILAQEDDAPFVPSNERLDDDLDRSLADEYSSSAEIPDAPDVPPSSVDDDDDDRCGIKLRLMGAFWRTQFKEVAFSHREGPGLGTGDIVKMSDPLDSENRITAGPRKNSDALDGDDAGLYEITLSLGRYVALRGGFQHSDFDYEHTIGVAGNPGPFTFGETTWGVGSVLASEFEISTGDLEVVLRPLNNEWITIDVSVGGRYTMWKTEFERKANVLSTTADARERDKLEALVPTVGVGLALRPIKQLEFFARARVGALSYERDADLRWNSYKDRWDRVERLEREAEMVEIDAGISLVLGETIGVIAGYRYSSYELERITDERAHRFEGEVGGFYAGAIIQF